MHPDFADHLAHHPVPEISEPVLHIAEMKDGRYVAWFEYPRTSFGADETIVHPWQDIRSIGKVLLEAGDVVIDGGWDSFRVVRHR